MLHLFPNLILTVNGCSAVIDLICHIIILNNERTPIYGNLQCDVIIYVPSYDELIHESLENFIGYKKNCHVQQTKTLGVEVDHSLAHRICAPSAIHC